MNKTYTGNRDGDSGKARAGLLEFVKTVEQITDGALWNNGTYVKRDMRGKAGAMSVHSTGRAVDLSYRKMGRKGRRNGREMGLWLCDLLSAHSETLGVECVLDYFPAPHGRGYLCNRDSWLSYKTKTIGGAPKGDWLHVELAPRMADSPTLVKEAWSKVADSEEFLRMPKGLKKKSSGR